MEEVIKIIPSGDELGEPVIPDRMIRIADNPIRRGECSGKSDPVSSHQLVVSSLYLQRGRRSGEVTV